MNIKELQHQLEEAYTIKNLNDISLTLINLYKSRQFSILHQIGEIISDIVEIDITAEGKGFSKLIMLYHPDRHNFYMNDIVRLVKEDDFDGLLMHSHILKLQRIDEIAKSLNSFEDIDYSPVYEWDTEAEGYTITNDKGYFGYDDGNKLDDMRGIKDNDRANHSTKSRGVDFYDAIKLRQYGNLEIEFPPYYLEDVDEFELSSCNIVDLDGVQFCKHARTIDVSDNHIIDISLLSGLTLLEELNLSDNKVGSIDSLSNLINLRKLYLSNNQVEDITSLLELEMLDYADLSGNNISQEQVNMLMELGVKVDY